MTVRRFAAGVLAASMLVALSGCGNDTTPSTSKGADTVASLTQANFSRTVAAAQQAARSVHIDAAINAVGHSVSLSGDVKGFSGLGSVSMDMTVHMGGKQIDIRLVDEVVYLRGAGIRSPHGEPWVRIDLSDAANPLARMLDTASPDNLNAYLQAVKRLKDKGPAKVDGVATHHYTVTIDTAKAAALDPVAERLDVSGLGLPSNLTADVWLDGDNLPVRMTVDLGTAASLQAHFSHYGEPVSVQVPPANQVGSFSLGG